MNRRNEVICMGNTVRYCRDLVVYATLGRVVDMDEEDPRWVCVEFPGRLEWIHTRYLERVEG